MQKHETFNFKDKNELILKAGELGIELPFRDSFDNLFEPLKIGTKRIANRMVIHPMEGFDSEPDGGPSEPTYRRYKRFPIRGHRCT